MISCRDLRQKLSLLQEQALEFHQEFAKLQPLENVKELEQMNAIKKLFRQMTKGIKDLQDTLEPLLRLHLAEKILGRENVHGVEDVELLLGFTLDRSKIPTIPYTKADFEKSKEIKEKTGIQGYL